MATSVRKGGCAELYFIYFTFTAYWCFSHVYGGPLPATPSPAAVFFDASSKTFSVKDKYDKNAVAWAVFESKIYETGWAFLEVHTNSAYSDQMQAYAAGIAEAHLTKDLIYHHWINTAQGYCDDQVEECQQIGEYLMKNAKWIADQINKYDGKDPYWHQVRLLIEQLHGLEDGFQNNTIIWDPNKNVLYYDAIKSDFGFLFFQVAGDLEDLTQAIKAGQGQKGHFDGFAFGQRRKFHKLQDHLQKGKDIIPHSAKIRKSTAHRHVMGSGSCSALIKLMPGNADLFVAQDTWSFYQDMLRIQKLYDFGYHLKEKGDELIPGRRITFSSYPGYLFSMDDFYLISSGLATLETTIGNMNADLWKYVTPTGTVLEWMRTMVANRLATSGSEWTMYFKKWNSGTYNNQWMVVDYNKFSVAQGRPGPLPSGVLFVLEQLPGLTVAEDLTRVLQAQQYWPSYNIPYFEEISNASGVPAHVARWGDWFSYRNSPRAKIFRRDQANIRSWNDFVKLMRYNDFRQDPLSACNCTPPYSGENTIAARSDLNPANGTYPFSALGHRSHGAIDMKATNFSMFRNGLRFEGISSPPYGQVEPFCWSKADFAWNTPHMGHPDCWTFGPVVYNWNIDP